MREGKRASEAPPAGRPRSHDANLPPASAPYSKVATLNTTLNGMQ